MCKLAEHSLGYHKDQNKPRIACSQPSAWLAGLDEPVACKQQHLVSKEKINGRSKVSQNKAMKHIKTTGFIQKVNLK